MTPTELKRQKPSGCDQGMGPLPAILYHHVPLRMEAHAKEGRDRRCLGFVPRVSFNSLELPHQPWRGYTQTSLKRGKKKHLTIPLLRCYTSEPNPNWNTNTIHSVLMTEDLSLLGALTYLIWPSNLWTGAIIVPGGSVVRNPPTNAGHSGLISGSGRSPGGGNGNPLQYSCLENPMDGGAWWTTAHGLQRLGNDLQTK